MMKEHGLDSAQVLEAIEDPALVADRYGTIKIVNDKASRLFGVCDREVLGRKLAEYFPHSRLPEVLVSGVALSGHQVSLRSSTYSVSYLPLRGTGEEEVLVIFRDMGELLAARRKVKSLSLKIKALVLTCELYRVALAQSAVGLAVADRGGKLLFINRAYAELIGGAVEEDLVGLPVKEAIPFSNLPSVMEKGVPTGLSTMLYRNRRIIVAEEPIELGGKVVGGVSKAAWADLLETGNLLDRFRLLESKLESYRSQLICYPTSGSAFDAWVGEAPQIKGLKQLAAKVARGDATILITGESGTGKDLLARCIHNASNRAGEPFVKINCAAIPDNLLEAELFGYEEGAFTGAIKGGKPGKFELADRGTIFLDEIGDMPLSMQAKVLRVLQEKSFERVGGNKTLSVDVRFIVATNQPIDRLLDEQRFRADLYYRISVINLEMPPLRDRRGDIPLIARAIIRRLGEKYGKAVEDVSDTVRELFTLHPWPGNVRQMENVLEYAFNLIEEGCSLIEERHLPQSFWKAGDGKLACKLEDVVSEAERQALLRALEACRGNKTEAARLLGIHRSGFYQKLKKHGIRN